MNLEVEVSGLKFKNPIIVGSAGYAEDENGIKKFIKRGYAGLVTKSTSKEPLAGAPPPRVFWYDPYRRSWVDGAEAHRNPGIEKMALSIKACKDLAEKENFHIIGSASFNTLEEAIYVATKFEEAGVSALELDLICTNVGPHLGADFATRGIYWANPNEPERTLQLLRALKNAVDIPIWAKIPVRTIVKNEAIEREGNVDAFSFQGDRMIGLAIDIESGKPIFSGNTLLKIKKRLKSAPYSQPILSSTVLATAFLKSRTNMPLIPSGAIARGFDAIQTMMAGAKAVQICTAVYRDINVIDDLVREMAWFMNKKGYDNIEEIVGIAVDKVPFDVLDVPYLH